MIWYYCSLGNENQVEGEFLNIMYQKTKFYLFHTNNFQVT